MLCGGFLQNRRNKQGSLEISCCGTPGYREPFYNDFPFSTNHVRSWPGTVLSHWVKYMEQYSDITNPP